MINYQKNIKAIIILVFLYPIISASEVNNLINELTIQSTTSTRDSGFYDYIIPKFTEEYSIKVKVIAVGTGQAINNAKNCDGDILIVHSKDDEMRFMNNGYGLNRKKLMYNDFIIIGPKNDPLDISTTDDPIIVFDRLFNNNKFISRGDDSGTHRAEINMWKKFGYQPEIFSQQFYYETGQGMGATLNIAIGLNAYTFTDRATWINFKNKGNHRIVFQDTNLLFNQYGIIRVSNEKCPNVNVKASQIFYNWILSDIGKKLITEYKVNNEQLFFTK